MPSYRFIDASDEEVRPETALELPPIGIFQYLMLRTVARLTADKLPAYGLSIAKDMSRDLGAAIELPQCYVTLKRLEAAGHLESSDQPAPGGTAHKVKAYRLTKSGAAVLKSTRECLALIVNLDQKEDGNENYNGRKRTAPSRGARAGS